MLTRAKLHSAESKHFAPDPTLRNMSPVEVGVALHWPGFAALGLPKEVDTTEFAIAMVNHGRWIAQCPWCPSAAYVSLSDRRFFCCECYNFDVDGKWINVIFPEDAEEIALLLGMRPRHENRNWLPGETLEMIREENARNGVL
jgi:hypothetical protein